MTKPSNADQAPKCVLFCASKGIHFGGFALFRYAAEDLDSSGAGQCGYTCSTCGALELTDQALEHWSFHTDSSSFRSP